MGVKGKIHELGLILPLITLFSVAEITQAWQMKQEKLRILRCISQGAPRLRQHLICTSRHWQHGRGTQIYVGSGKNHFLPFLPLLLAWSNTYRL